MWKLDRLGRSVKKVLTLAGSYTPTGEGKFFFTIMAASAADRP